MNSKDTRTDWLIGAGSFCDLVIDQPAVSSRHCQVTMVDGQLTLNDLDSTNGTWVNDTRITTAVPIGPDDTIRLGTQTEVTWAQIERLVSFRVIRIGRHPDNDVVLSDDKVSGQHARLLIDGRQLTLIDLESGNGTAVGTPDRKISRAQVSPDDDVYFATAHCRVSELMAAASVGSTRPSESGNSRSLMIPVAAVAVLLLIFCLFVFRSPTTQNNIVASSPVAEPDTPELNPLERMERSLFAVVVRTAVSEPGLRVGTAWVISERRLATSGNIVLFLQQAKAEFPIVTVQRVFDGEEHSVIGSVVHPVCQANGNRMQKLGKQIDDARNNLESTTTAADSDDSAKPSAVNSLVESILTLEDQWFVAAEDMIHFDVGLLETKNSVTAGLSDLPLDFAAQKPSRLASATVAGAAFVHDQSIVLESSRLPLETLEGTLESFLAYNQDGIPRLVLKCSVDHIRKNWMGAPVLDSSGQVIGLYSRPTPSPDPDTPPDGSHCDIVSIARVTELLSTLE